MVRAPAPGPGPRKRIDSGSVFSGLLVRSSYRVAEQRHAAESGRGAVSY